MSMSNMFSMFGGGILRPGEIYDRCTTDLDRQIKRYQADSQHNVAVYDAYDGTSLNNENGGTWLHRAVDVAVDRLAEGGVLVERAADGHQVDAEFLLQGSVVGGFSTATL